MVFTHAIKIEALAQLGRMLKDTPKNTGTKGVVQSGMKGATGGDKVEPPVTAPTLKDLGLDKKTSSMAQKPN